MIAFKEIPNEEKPRERLILYGAQNLNNEELLMILLKSGTKKNSVKELANEVLSKCGGISNLKNMTLQKLREIDGIGRVKAIELMALIEISRRMYACVHESDIVSFTDPVTIVKYFNELFYDKKQEEFYCVYLAQKKKYIDKKRIFVGTINSSIVHPREVFKGAYLLSASYLICIHNHPSGDPLPSKEDIAITEKLKRIGELHGIYLVDHLIIGSGSYYSFYEDSNVLHHN